jgi:hypothetical protein
MVIASDKHSQLVQKTKHSDNTEALITEHHAKYHQMEGTPPMRAPLLHQLGHLGLDKEAYDILQGQYNWRPGTDDASAAILQHLKTVNPCNRTLPVGISTAVEYQQGWNKIKERTLAGGNTLHFGHLKAIAKDADLSEMESAFIYIPLWSGYVFKALMSWHKPKKLLIAGEYLSKLQEERSLCPSAAGGLLTSLGTPTDPGSIDGQSSSRVSSNVLTTITLKVVQ